MARLLAILYAVFSYLVFFATFLYLTGFVAGLGVPKHVDSGAAGSALVAWIVDLGLLGLFAVQHSVMARPAFKRWWTRYLPPALERSTYVLLSSLALVAMFVFWQPLPRIVWDVQPHAARLALHGVAALGWLLVLSSSFLINHVELFGLRQAWRHGRAPGDAGAPPFVTRAFYRIVRHPLMLGFLIAFWAAPTMSLGHLLLALVNTAYIVLAVKLLEERDLIATYGDTYRSYQRRVPMLLPLPMAGARARADARGHARGSAAKGRG